ncbi:glycosyltransferase family 4 protein [Mariniflexile sp. AS56]|uniref:glycosyltransferase family 4 protein n=1 Tax=Mariniflexile sp. AS56 TaxID=3063957 RepID=UPI0026ECD98A|nr:glycosyltransferase family 4 protein [Mariniflexile sp. AS56]MDO7172707.1 glycosyltransferase family 4 protein [Mariniflexile sp. AS56]
MRFLVITNAPTLQQNHLYAAYAPYVKEMDIWFKYVDDVVIVSPTTYHHRLLLQTFKKQPTVISIPSIAFTSLKSVFSSIIKIPIIVWAIFKACKKADHIHLRCPGNIGLLGCFVQILFPKKPKTAKYAGNWDPNAKQPFSYKLQKWILSNTFLTKNMQVLVYGDWQNQSKNIKPFFTASYANSEIEVSSLKDYSNELKFVFVGTLVEGKRPLLAIHIVETLQKEGKQVRLDLYGEGVLKEVLQEYISNNHLDDFISLHGNQEKSIIKEALKGSHFLILLSKSEGWPKAVAEAMFFGTIPITTSVSCIPFMLNEVDRGILVKPELTAALIDINKAINNVASLKRMSNLASNWSQQYTLEVFDAEISKLLHKI